jgi:hypothetical protein
MLFIRSKLGNFSCHAGNLRNGGMEGVAGDEKKVALSYKM